MAVYSTVPAVKAALVAQLPGMPQLSGVAVTYSHPGNVQRPTAVWLGDAEGPVEPPVFRGPARVVRQERYTLDLWIACADPGPDATNAEAAAYGIYQGVEDLLADNPTLGVSGVIKALPEHVRSAVGFDDAYDGGWICVMRIQVGVEARLN